MCLKWRYDKNQCTVYDKIVIETTEIQKNERIWNQRNFYITFHLKDCLGLEFTIQKRRADDRGIAGIIYSIGGL